ncbi:MAG TPA: hypothetical protein VLA19_32355 [Herpetosiphonaceae bacterium]|nr:hypothetical protein [Herpetosiphonaceae bacterium]
MSVEHTRPETERTSDSRPTTYLHGRWLLLARLAWIGFALTALILFALNIVPRTHQLTRTSGEVWRLVFRQLGEGEQATLARNGLSAHVYAWYVTGCEVLAVVVCAVVGLFIFVRSSRDWMAMLGSLTVMLLGICNNTYLLDLAFAQPTWQVPVALVLTVGGLAFILFLYLFPDGRFVPSWTRWLTLILVPAFLVGDLIIIDPSRFSTLLASGPLPIFLVLQAWFVPAGIGVYAQVSRYRHVSDPAHRQQSKWVVVGVVAVFSVVLVNASFWTYVSLTPPGTARLVYVVVAPPLFTLGTLLLPMAISLAILRYHLYEIDVVINRALVYGSLSALLGLAYAGSVIVLQEVFRPLVGADSDLATVGATLIIVVCSQPLRRRIQATIDQRFYRRKYDAAKTLAAFATRVRQETDLQRLVSGTLAVVEDTVQPAHVSLWLREGSMRPSRD